MLISSAVGCDVIASDWFPGGTKTGEPCEWSFNVTEGSVATPDHWLPPDTKCTYTFRLLPQHYLDVIINVYGLGFVTFTGLHFECKCNCCSALNYIIAFFSFPFGSRSIEVQKLIIV